MVGVADNLTVADTMDLHNEFNCAEYVDDGLSASDAAW